MVVDTSALLTIALGEEGHEQFLNAIVNAPVAVVSTVNLYEACIVLYMKRRSRQDVSALLRLVADLDIRVLDFNAATAVHAGEAYFKYGKGLHREFELR